MKGSGPNLLDLEELMNINLDWANLNRLSAPTTLEDVLKGRAGLFNSELGTLKGMKESLFGKADA